MGRGYLGVGVIALLVLASAGCRRKPKTLDAPPPLPMPAIAPAPSAAPRPPPPPFVAPEAAAGDVFVLGGGATVRVDAKGKISRDAKVSILDVTTGPGGTVYGLTSTEVRKLVKGSWKGTKPFGDKTTTAILLSKTEPSLRVTPGARAVGTHVLTSSQQWSGALEESGTIGGDHDLLHAQLDGAGNLWGVSLDDKLVTRTLTGAESPAWAPSKPIAFAGRARAGVYVLGSDRVVFTAADKSTVTVPLPFTAAATARMAVGPTDVCVVRSGDDVAFVSPAGGLTTTKAKLSEVWAVDGRGRIWTLNGSDLAVVGTNGAVIASRPLPAATKAFDVKRIIALGGGAEIK